MNFLHASTETSILLTSSRLPIHSDLLQCDRVLQRHKYHDTHRHLDTHIECNRRSRYSFSSALVFCERQGHSWLSMDRTHQSWLERSAERSSGVFHRNEPALTHQHRLFRGIERNPVSHRSELAYELHRRHRLPDAQASTRPAFTPSSLESGKIGPADQHRCSLLSGTNICLLLLSHCHARGSWDDELGYRHLCWYHGRRYVVLPCTWAQSILAAGGFSEEGCIPIMMGTYGVLDHALS